MLATAKIHILKQFTTGINNGLSIVELCLPLQRYTFWSNSQPTSIRHAKQSDCACHCKDTHFEAIHNTAWSGTPAAEIVLATAKIHILKQFTTVLRMLWSLLILCLPLQRYTFWSNSQPTSIRHAKQSDCACHCKDTHFEAIHNIMCIYSVVPQIVLATAKIHILKQFTTSCVFILLFLRLCLPLQRYTFWSNSQQTLY